MSREINTGDYLPFLTTCPFCYTENDMMMKAGGDKEEPKDGSVNICFSCLTASTIDASSPGNCRKPTDEEQRIIDNNVYIQNLLNYAAAVKKQKP